MLLTPQSSGTFFFFGNTNVFRMPVVGRGFFFFIASPFSVYSKISFFASDGIELLKQPPSGGEKKRDECSRFSRDRCYR